MKLKKRLINGEVVFGPWCVLPSAASINVIASVGIDFVIIDMEHGPMSYEKAEDMVRAANSEGCSVFIRVPRNNEAEVLRALDIGAEGVVIPHIMSKAEAEKAISYAKYYPLGQRGFSPFTRAGRYSLDNLKTHTKTQNDNSMVVLILEGKEGVDSLDDILTIDKINEKVDIIYIGAYDLSQAIGFPGQVDHPEVIKILKQCIKKICSKGVIAGGYVAKNKDDIAWMKKMGMQFITLLPDCTVLYHAFERFIK